MAEERTRIAREMHDVVAHSLSVMVVQAEAAEAMLDSDPERARRPLAAVQQTGRGALTELRRMLGVLREMADEGPDLAPQPGLSGLDELAQPGARGRAAGDASGWRASRGRCRPASTSRPTGSCRRASPTRSSTPGPRRAEVVVRYEPARARARGRATTAAAATRDANGGGHGLVGMRERVAVYGGELTAGRRGPGAASRSSARLPLEVLGAP